MNNIGERLICSNCGWDNTGNYYVLARPLSTLKPPPIYKEFRCDRCGEVVRIKTKDQEYPNLEVREEKTLEDYEKTYQEFWKPLMETEGGKLNLDQIKRELHDFHTLMHNVSLVYDYVTGGLISKPMTDPGAVKSEADDHYRQLFDEEIAEMKKDAGFFNQLSPAEAERLWLLVEEMGETLQAIGKIGRHGYESTHPDGGPSNLQNFEKELGHVYRIIKILARAKDIRWEVVLSESVAKEVSMRPYLHHQGG